jgi:hypothetical protein
MSSARRRSDRRSRALARVLFAASLACVASLASTALSAEPTDAREVPDVRGSVPIVAYAYSAHGPADGSVGAQAYGLGVGAPGQRATVGGGGTLWGSIGRLTLVGDGARDVFGNFAPSAAAIVRFYGDPMRGLSLGALGRYKIDGFGLGPNREIESEIESGVILSYAAAGYHLDANAIVGAGLGDAGEIDLEGRLRAGRDLGRLLRLGVDGEARTRASGDARLPGGRTWDFTGGPQVLVGSGALFGALTAGPATMGVTRGVGWSAMLSFGGVSL